jgi:putative toxin-antitoxin system antitoxin component (TIGR02293 family)
MMAHSMAERLGGAFGSQVESDLDLVEAIRRGLPMRVVDAALASGLIDQTELFELVVPRRTLTHRREKRQGLTPDQSDRLLRVVRVVLRAEEALADREKAHRWLRKPNRALAGHRPIDLLASDVGARMVERVLGRLEHGVYS